MKTRRNKLRIVCDLIRRLRVKQDFERTETVQNSSLYTYCSHSWLFRRSHAWWNRLFHQALGSFCLLFSDRKVWLLLGCVLRKECGVGVWLKVHCVRVRNINEYKWTEMKMLWMRWIWITEMKTKNFIWCYKMQFLYPFPKLATISYSPLANSWGDEREDVSCVRLKYPSCRSAKAKRSLNPNVNFPFEKIRSVSG